MRRWSVLLLCAVLFLTGCAQQAPAAATPEPSAEMQPEASPSAAPQKNMALIGYVIEDDRSMSACMAMQGFLHMAETLGYPAKLYRAAGNAQGAVDAAIADGCKGLLIEDRAGANDGAVTRALAAGIKVVVPYDRCAVQGLHANVVADTEEYPEEIMRGLAARMAERSLKSGRILLYGAAAEAQAPAYIAAVAAYCPQYSVVTFSKTAADDAAAVEELAAFLLYNRDIKGMYVLDPTLAPVAVQGRNRAQARFRSEGTPSPSPTAAPGPEETPAPTPAPGLLTQIAVTIFANGLRDENLALFNDNDIYALCIEPYYDAAAQSAMTLDRLLRGDVVAAEAQVDRPIVNAATIDKYLAIYTQTKEMFGL